MSMGLADSIFGVARNMKRLRPQEGFTIIELMIVVAIIGILAAMALAAYNNLNETAQIATEDGIIGRLNSAAAITLGKLGVLPTEVQVMANVSPPVTDLSALSGAPNAGHSGVAYCPSSVVWVASTSGNHPTNHIHQSTCP